MTILFFQNSFAPVHSSSSSHSPKRHDISSIDHCSNHHGDLNNDRWMKYHASLGYEMNWNYVLEQTNFGKTKWSRYIKGERVSLEPIKASDDEDSK